jgi:hypothetical protein
MRLSKRAQNRGLYAGPDFDYDSLSSGTYENLDGKLDSIREVMTMNGLVTESRLPRWAQRELTALVGFWDRMSWEAGPLARDLVGLGDSVDMSSSEYRWGSAVGTGTLLGMTVGFAAFKAPPPAAPAPTVGGSVGPANVRIRTGDAGEVRSAFARIESGNIGQGTATNGASTAFARSLGNATDDAGHAIGRNLGGLGGARSGNIFPQAPSVNRGAFNQFEQQIARRVLAGDQVFVRVVPRYNPGATRPFEISYQVRINGLTTSRTFPNP